MGTVQRCIQSASLLPGTHSFFFWTQRILNEGSNWTQKKNRIFMQITNSRNKQRHTIRKFVFLFKLKLNQIKSNVGFLWRGENQSTRGKTSHSRKENQQTQPTYGYSALTASPPLLSTNPTLVSCYL